MDTLNSRQHSLLRFIEDHGTVTISTLIERIPASEATVRRDLALLEEKQLILRRRGEVFALKKSLESAFQQREKLNRSAKQAIAHLAADLIQDNDTIILDAGSTTLEIARLLTTRSGLTVVTNSLPVANILASSPVSLLFAGGHLYSQNMSTQGPEAEAFFKKIEVNKAFVGASGVRRGVGLETLNPYEAQIKRLMIRSAKQAFGVVDSSKFETAGVNVFCEFSELDFLVTDKPVSDPTTCEVLKKHNVEILIPETKGNSIEKRIITISGGLQS